MKHFSNILKYSLFLSLVVAMVSCGGSDSDDPTPDGNDLQGVVDLLTAGEASFSSVSKPTDATELEWDDLIVKFTGGVDGGTYTTTGSANTDVWPASGTWTFKEGSNGSVIVRDGTTDVAISVSATELETTFTVDQPAARTKVVGGEWKFGLGF